MHHEAIQTAVVVHCSLVAKSLSKMGKASRFSVVFRYTAIRLHWVLYYCFRLNSGVVLLQCYRLEVYCGTGVTFLQSMYFLTMFDLKSDFKETVVLVIFKVIFVLDIHKHGLDENTTRFAITYLDDLLV